MLCARARIKRLQTPFSRIEHRGKGVYTLVKAEAGAHTSVYTPSSKRFFTVKYKSYGPGCSPPGVHSLNYCSASHFNVYNQLLNYAMSGNRQNTTYHGQNRASGKTSFEAHVRDLPAPTLVRCRALLKNCTTRLRATLVHTQTHTHTRAL